MSFLNGRLLLVSLVAFPLSYLFARKMQRHAETLDGELAPEQRICHELPSRRDSRDTYNPRLHCGTV